MSAPVVIREARPDEPAARSALAGYWRDIVGRYYERAATDHDVAQAFADFPSGDLVAPTGALLIAGQGELAVGCAGLRWSDGPLAGLARVWVAEHARRRGLAAQLLADAERRALDHGCRLVQLEVRSDLVEAQRLYRASGSEQTTAFSSGRLYEAAFRKRLG